MSTVRPRPAPVIESLPAAPLVLVLVGTDHHPFARVVAWADGWGADRPDVRLLVQHGRTPAPSRVPACDMVPNEELQALLREAAVVVAHGGPATIMEARRAGLVPVVVPRDPSLGEHVDEHQQLFSRRMAREGMVVLCEDVDDLARVVEGALASPADLRVRAESEQERREAAARRVGAVISAVVDEGRRRRSRRGVGLRRR